MKLMKIRNGEKWTMSASSGLGLLPMISEIVTKQCVSEMLGPQKGLIGRFHIDWRGKKHFLQGSETSPY